ncbi:ketopantoate hydroxymethyltransferase [Halospina denitrificans]|uniref:3-methyl-2-oxobutanoate hydroxymethyltransferase n=1 Tax=Halospina denitrificans TaxID=332522 RepID=A0A4R7K4K9_9GAMM|nr:3-methyl-2-oxobutanoate hydroxymethyltransferase [Halospina denitrificans]TDT44589.1 ketopantoate hydroxymethyltransferase [Halospina denitrificans]
MTATIQTLQERKANQEKFSCLTAYDATFASLLSQCGIDVILVGDSLGMVLQGKDSTLPVSMEDMVYHTESVARGRPQSLIMADMPFMSYATNETSMANAARLMQAGAHMVKLEGTDWMADTIHRLSERGIPVCAHLGLTPQFVNKLGGYRVQGRDSEAADRMVAHARMLVDAGSDLVLLECVPAPLAERITREVSVPVIGIGAGADTDGQVLVLHDMLGITQGHRPRFVKDFLAEAGSVPAAIEAYDQAVKSGQFPTKEHSFRG